MKLPGGDKLISIRVEEVDQATGLPAIVNNVTIYANISFVMHTNGMQLSVRKVSIFSFANFCCVGKQQNIETFLKLNIFGKNLSALYLSSTVEVCVLKKLTFFSQVADITAKSGQFSTVGEVLNVLARVKGLTTDSKDHLEAAAKILDALIEQRTEDEVRLVATFAAEQLRLVSKPPHGRRYSSFLLGNAVIWDRTSPMLYEMMYNCAIFCLPHSRTLRRITSALQVKSGLDSATMTYLSMRVGKLEPRERLVNLAMDEVYTAQSVELAGGRVYGETAGMVTKTLFCSHINSVAGKYEDMISMLPVPHVTRDDIEKTFNKVLKGLTELGYKVVSVTTDNHRTNQSWHNSLGDDGRHSEYILNPYSKDEERIYTLYDTVHIFKNLFYGLLRNRTLTVPPFPGSKVKWKIFFSLIYKFKVTRNSLYIN